jgi:hypothetical protein
MTILLSEVWPIGNLRDYKLHFARWNGDAQPLDVWVRSREEWQGWQEYWPNRNDFNRPYVFSLIQFYHEVDTWLFGGVFRVLGLKDNRYEVQLSDERGGFAGRLKLQSPYRERSTRVNFENHYASFAVSEILREEYTGRSFPGYEDIDISFAELETLVRNERADWKVALGSVKGVYLITDTKTARRYVGSAYGTEGIWSRWCAYVTTGHGGNVELRSLLKEPSLDYCRTHFQFALLEHRFSRTPDDVILARESYWKRVLLARGEDGLNRN